MFEVVSRIAVVGFDAARAMTVVVGVFDDSVFDDSVFDDSVFDDGVFDDGVFDDGVFDDGVFDDGVFDDGVFDDGVFDDGTFDDATFDDATFDDGTFARIGALCVVVGSHSARRGARDATLPHAGAPDAIWRGRARTIAVTPSRRARDIRTRSGSIARGAFHGSRGGFHGSVTADDPTDGFDALDIVCDSDAADAGALDAALEPPVRSAIAAIGLDAIATTANNFVSFFFIRLPLLHQPRRAGHASVSDDCES